MTSPALPRSLRQIARLTKLALLLALAAYSPGIRAATFQTVVSAANSSSALVTGPDGNLYGVTRYGGTNDLGAICRLTSGGAYQVLYSFTAGTDGSHPGAALVVGPDQQLYGTCQYGGNQNAGAIFKISTAGVFTPLHTLAAGTDGAEPCAALVVGTDNLLHGTASVGGTSGFGTLFQITTGGVFTVRHPFTGTDGSSPMAALVSGADGLLYGTSQHGGQNGFGTVFKITTSGTFTSLFSFGGTNGAYPASALVQGGDLAFYGATPYGGSNDLGGFFKITTLGAFTPLYNSRLEISGSNPAGLTLAPNGIFYGPAQYGGTNNFGALFQFTNGAYTTLYTFTGGGDGENPSAPLLSNSGYNLYGTTAWGGNAGGGTIYDLTLLHLISAWHIGNHVISSGAGGDPGAGYTILSSTNLAALRGTWGVAGSGSFDANGTFIFTNTVNPLESKRFYVVREP